MRRPRWARLAIGFITFVALGFVPLLGPAWATPADETLVATLNGDASVLYDSQRDACAPIDVPDINPRAFRDARGQVVMFALHFQNRPLRGPDLTHLKLDCTVALGSALDADPAHYDDRRYITATWTNDGRIVDALVHHEYHADQHGRCSVTDSLRCWFNTILAFRSDDGGAHFKPATPLVVASAPFTQDHDQGRHRGFFNPTNIVRDGAFYYVFTSTTGWPGQDAGSCLFRTRTPDNSGSWRAFDGRDFTVSFVDPYVHTPHQKPCATIKPFLLPVGSITHHRGSGLWLAVFQASAGGDYPVDGFYYAVGRDLLHWGAPKLLRYGKTAYNDLCTAKPSVINYPAVLDPDTRARNFDETGDHPLLFFSIIGVENCQTTQRLLVYQHLDLKRAHEPTTLTSTHP